MNEQQRAYGLSDIDLVDEIESTPIGEHPLVRAMVQRFRVQPQSKKCPACHGEYPKVSSCGACDGSGVDLS